MGTKRKKTVSFLKKLLDMVLPPVCYVCGKNCSGKYGLCVDCLEKIRRISPPHCSKCGRTIKTAEASCPECSSKETLLEKSWSCCHYDSTVKSCVHLFKYGGYMGLTDIFRDIMADFVKKNEILKEIDFIIPVPMYTTKKRERSYNHAEILAKSLSKNFEIPLDTTHLKKIKWSPSQSELNKKKRFKNVENTFLVIDKNVFSGKNVLLVDDVYTTGATINECAKALSEARAGRVFSLTLARGA